MFSPAVSGALAKTPRQTSITERKRKSLEYSPLLEKKNEKKKIEEKSKFSTWNFVQISQSIIYGIINSILTIPCMYGYAAIIYSHPDFITYMPSLVKLVLFSSVVHQIMFTILSTLPFAIGQVQDAGLIFLSAIASSICQSLGETTPLEEKVATVVICIGICTASLGAVLVLLGKFKLAKLVSYLPMPVVGGYLAFIGLFCLFAALSLCTGLQINSIPTLSLLWNTKSIILCLPSFAGGIFLLLISKYSTHPAALPFGLIALPIVFYIILFSSGYSMEDAREYGWVGKLVPSVTFTEIWVVFDFSKVHWNQLLRQITTWLGMTFVVAFSSCLDVAAIEMDMGKQLDINHELATVGWSNFISGCCGGYTGSYIFSQTIFTHRTNTNSRIVGICVIFSEFLICLLPITIMSYLPLYFFSSTLMFIAIDLMIEWLIHVFWKILIQEYIVLVCSFIAINCVSLELGMLIGIGFAIINFLLGYSQVQVVERVPKRSCTVRTYAGRSILSKERDAIVCLQLHGFLFFGSSIRIMDDVKHQVKIKRSTTYTNVDSTCINKKNTTSHTITNRTKSLDLGSFHSNHLDLEFNSVHSNGLQCLDGNELDEQDSTSRPTQYVILDFKRVTGMDATAARSCFMILQQLCTQHNIQMIYTSLLPSIEALLRQNEVLPSTKEMETETGTRVFDNVDNALEFCEDQLLSNHVKKTKLHNQYGSTTNSLGTPLYIGSTGFTSNSSTSSLEGNCSLPTLLTNFLGLTFSSISDFSRIEDYFRFQQIPKGHILYSPEEDSNELYLLSSGNIELQLPKHGIHLPDAPRSILEHVRPGVIFGEVDFFAQQERQMWAVALSDSLVYCLNREEYIRMEREDPLLWKAFRELIIRSMALGISNSNWLLDLSCRE